MAQAATIDTRQRLLDAATTLFADRGFHRTTVRDIAELADVNLAAANYHFGSKRDLYLEVLRQGFAGIRAAITRRRADLPAPRSLARLPRAKVEALLAARIRTMFEMVIGPPPGVHARLMQREMTDPSEALPIIVEEFIRPMRGELETLVAALEPSLDAAARERSANSVIGQVLFYRFCRPALLQMAGLEEFSRAIAEAIADHVIEFALGGIERRGRRGKGRARA